MTKGGVDKIDRKDEIFLPIGHYALFNCKNNPLNESLKISIYGLGSCIALILFDCNKKVSGMSHILLPKAHKNNKTEFPHKYADLSVKLLMKGLLELGANKENIQAIIVGGSKIFDLDENIIGIDNIKAIKSELGELRIKLIGEDTGGSKGRAVIFDTKDFSVYVKTTKENKFKKLN